MSSPSGSFLVCDHLSFAYPSGRLVIRDLNFSIDRGQTLAIVGASGCGKSTLLKLISGLAGNHISGQKLSGGVRINGKEANDYVKGGTLAFMFQEPTLLANRSVWENVSLPLELMNRDTDIVDGLLDVVGLGSFANSLPNSLSGGMKTRVALARSFSTSPDLLLLDEPFSALDIAWKQSLYLELEALKQKLNATIVLVSHDVQEALLLADRVLVLNASGELELDLLIDSSFSVSERVADISGFMATVYKQYMFPIQDAIMNDKKVIR